MHFSISVCSEIVQLSSLRYVQKPQVTVVFGFGVGVVSSMTVVLILKSLLKPEHLLCSTGRSFRSLGHLFVYLNTTSFTWTPFRSLGRSWLTFQQVGAFETAVPAMTVVHSSNTTLERMITERWKHQVSPSQALARYLESKRLCVLCPPATRR